MSMNKWYLCKVSYERQTDSIGMKKVTESYLVDALSFTEAEERVIREVTAFVSMGALEVVNIRRMKIAEIIGAENDQADTYFKAKVEFISIDEASGQEKKSPAVMVVKAQNLKAALLLVEEVLEQTISNAQISKVEEFPILDIYTYETSEGE
nr:MAG TPA: protein of unknown function (DUF4494) [Caudoviricetes sp.]